MGSSGMFEFFSSLAGETQTLQLNQIVTEQPLPAIHLLHLCANTEFFQPRNQDNGGPLPAAWGGFPERSPPALALLDASCFGSLGSGGLTEKPWEEAILNCSYWAEGTPLPNGSSHGM